MQDKTKEMRIMKRRGRPRKPEMENSTVRKPRALRLSGENYIAKSKPVTRNLIAMEVSPTKDESKGWTLEQWTWFAHRFIEERDMIEFKNKEGKVSFYLGQTSGL